MVAARTVAAPPDAEGGARVAQSLGIDLGGTAMKWVTLEEGTPRAEGSVPTPHDGAEAVLAAMVDLAAAIGRVEALGVGVPGLYEPDGSTTLLPNVPGAWEGFPLGPRLGEAVGAPVALCNDARAFTLAELRLGAGRGCRSLVALTLGTGVGGGVASAGRLHLGAHQRGGEVGHQVVDPDGMRCGCGARGCVETVASAPAIVAAAARVVWQGVGSSLAAACGEDPSGLTAEIVAEQARRGDDHAVDIMDRAGWALGAAVANAATILAPERVVIGGGVSSALDVLRPALERTLVERARLPDTPQVVAAELGARAGAIGAGLWALEPEEHLA